MHWADTVKSTALAALAERTATAGRSSVVTPWSWSPHEVWLSRAKQSGERAARFLTSEPSTPAAQGLAPRE